MKLNRIKLVLVEKDISKLNSLKTSERVSAPLMLIVAIVHNHRWMC